MTPGTLIGPWLERLPNIGDTRAKRLIAAFGHDLQTVLSDIDRASEVAKLIEPTKPALTAKIFALGNAVVDLYSDYEVTRVGHSGG